jgi:uncharacterized protein YktB (UPF0637 family)
VHFFFISIKDSVHFSLESFKEDIFHLISDFIEKASYVFVLIKVIEQPSKSLIDSHDIIMEIIKPSAVVISKLPGENVNESRIRLKVIKRVNNFLEVQIDVSVKIFESDWMCNLILALPLF